MVNWQQYEIMKSRNVFLTSILGIWAVNFAAWGAGFTVASTDYVDAVVENAAAPMVKHTANTAAGSETVPVYIAADGTATPITAYSGNAATATSATTATRATADADGNVITTTYATKSEL